MGLIALHKWPVLAVSILLLFALLLLLQAGIQAIGDRRAGPVSVYTQLGQVLERNTLLPFSGVGEMRAVLSSLQAGDLTADPARINSFQALEGMWHVYANDNRVAWIEIDPQRWQDFPQPEIAQSLRRIARADYQAQAQAARRAQGLRTAPSDFSFIVTAGGEEFEMTPLFEDQRCILVRITRPRSKNL